MNTCRLGRDRSVRIFSAPRRVCARYAKHIGRGRVALVVVDVVRSGPAECVRSFCVCVGRCVCVYWQMTTKGFMGTYKWRYYPTARKYLVVNCLWSFHLELWALNRSLTLCLSGVIFIAHPDPGTALVSWTRGLHICVCASVCVCILFEMHLDKYLWTKAH